MKLHSGLAKCLLLAVALGLTPSAVLAQRGVANSNERQVEPPILPPLQDIIEKQPGHTLEFDSNEKLKFSKNEQDGVTWDDGYLSSLAEDGSQVTKVEVSRVRECRRLGPGVYTFVDVEYQIYTHGGKKGRVITSFKIVKDMDGNSASCQAYQYNQEAAKAKEWGEPWETTTACEDTVKVPVGLVQMHGVWDPDTGNAIWIDQAGNEFVGYHDQNTGEAFWEGRLPGKPPPKPKREDAFRWRFPGGAEKQDIAADGTEHRHYPNGTDIYHKPDGKPNGTTIVVDKDGAVTVFEKSDPYVDRYDKVTKYPPGSLTSPGDVQKLLEKDPSAAGSLMNGPPSSDKKTTSPQPATKPASKSESKGGQKGAGKSASYFSKSDLETAQATLGTTDRTNCPPPTETLQPGKPITEKLVNRSFRVATDSTQWCTYGDAVPAPRILELVRTEEASTIPPSDAVTTADNADTSRRMRDERKVVKGPTPETAMSPTPKETPRLQTPESPKTASTPTPTPSPTETPVTTASNTPVPKTTDTPQQPTDTPTPQLPTDTPLQVTIFIKANEAVLDSSQTGDPIQGQIVKLVISEKPALPTTTNDRTTADKGFDKPAPQCTTGADGGCKIDVPPEDRPLYALDNTPRIGSKPVTKFRLTMNVMKHAGGVAETTGKQVRDLSDSVTGGNTTAEFVKIGNRTFLRLGFNTSKDMTEDLAEKLSKLLGVPVEIDICLVKEPGPPLGSEPASYSAINRELPNTEIRLQPSAKRGVR